MRRLVVVGGPCHNAGMAEIVNLRRVKKNLARDAADLDAAAARVQHGRSKGERNLIAQAKRTRDAVLDGARLDGSARDREPSK